VPRPQDEPTIESRYDNTIEMAFSKLKALLRKAAERTVDGLWLAIGQLIDTITPDECANFFAAAGYDPD
jgi:uncharacterized protein YdeI (YjbR/CyaY-like superfamily)